MEKRNLNLVHNRSNWLLFLILFVVVVLIASPVRAQAEQPGGPTDNEVNAIAKQLFCPVCENIPLDVCPTQACEEWRELIRLKLSEGWSEKQIKVYFVEQYGDRVLASPPARGFNWLIYVVPPLAIIIGAYFLYRAYKSLRYVEDVEEISVPVDEIDDDYVARLEEELRNR